jgi:hypothetical protein
MVFPPPGAAKAGKAHGHAAESGVDPPRPTVLHPAPCPAHPAARAAIEIFAGLGRDNLPLKVTRKAPARSKLQLKQAAISHMRKLAKLPQRVRAYFQHPQFRYAA